MQKSIDYNRVFWVASQLLYIPGTFILITLILSFASNSRISYTSRDITITSWDI